MLVRNATIDGAATVDARLVVTEDGRAALFGGPNGQMQLLAGMSDVPTIEVVQAHALTRAVALVLERPGFLDLRAFEALGAVVGAALAGDALLFVVFAVVVGDAARVG